MVAEEGDLFGVDAESIGKRILRRDVEQGARVLDEAGVIGERVGGFGVDVEEPELTGVSAQGALQPLQDAAQDGGEEGVVEKEDGGGEWEVYGRGVGVEDAERARLLPGCGERLEVLLGDVGERGIELDAEDVAEREAAAEQERAAFAAAEIDEGEAGEGVGVRRGAVRADGVFGEGEGAIEDGWSDAVVGGTPEGGAVQRHGVAGRGVELIAAKIAAGVDGEVYAYP